MIIVVGELDKHIWVLCAGQDVAPAAVVGADKDLLDAVSALQHCNTRPPFMLADLAPNWQGVAGDTTRTGRDPLGCSRRV